MNSSVVREADSAPPQTRALQVREVSIEQAEDGVAVAISSNGALVPAITKLDGPPRLVIDLAGAVTKVSRSTGSRAAGEIKGIRVSQYQQRPPLTRIVVDLSEPRDYAWETVPNKLLVHLRQPNAAAEEETSDSAPAFTTGVDSTVSGSRANVIFTGENPSASSTVTANQDTVVVDLARGGQIRVCPGTNVSLTSSRGGHDVMIGMNTGSVETHYGLSASADSILTPDFRILLAGPGRFDMAISADSRGNTCVRGLPGNSASAVVSELMGDGTFKVKPDEQIVFREGQLAKADHDVPIDCGCPAAENPVLRTEATRPVPERENADMTASNSDLLPRPTEARHLQFDAPLVFRGNEPLPAATEEATKLPVLTVAPGPMMIIPLPPPGIAESRRNAQQVKPKAGFFGHVRRFFTSVFG
jgi:hypothetical protein